MWQLLAPLVTGALGTIQGGAQQKAQKAQNIAQANMAAAQTEFSPWTHMGAGQANLQAPTASPLSGAVQGGLSGAMFGQKMAQGDLYSDLLKKKIAQPYSNETLQALEQDNPFGRG